MRKLILVVFAVAVTFAARAATPDDPAFAAGDFAAAEQTYQAVLAQTPDDPQALAGLARIRLYQEHRTDAVALAQHALKADPANSVARRVIAGVAARETSAGSWRITMPEGTAEAPFVVTDPLPVVTVTIGGSDHLFLIDTGAPDIVLDSDFAKELGLKPGGTQTGTFAGGAQAAFEHVVLPQMQVAGVTVEQVPASVLPTRAMSAARRIDGIIGTGFLMHFLATLNYAEGTLILRPRSASPEFEASVAEGQSVPMWLVGDHFLFARGRINDGPEGLFNIDTGLEGAGIQGTRAALEAAGVAIDETAVQTGLGGGGTVRFIPFIASATIGSVTVPQLNGVYTPDGDQYGLFAFQVSGSISHQFFRERTVTFDFDAMRMVIR